MARRLDSFEGIRPIRRNLWFGHGMVDPGNWPVTPWEPRLGQIQAMEVFNWPGGGAPTALVLGPSSWGFGIGPWWGTATYFGPQFPATVRV